MHALTADQYAWLYGLAQAWTRCHLQAAKTLPVFNPRLAADALCFQRLEQADGEWLLGALVTPLSLSLVMVPAQPDGTPVPAEGSRRRLSLPYGEYELVAEYFDDEYWCWRRELLDDLGDVADREQASRLAQRLMETLMTPEC